MINLGFHPGSRDKLPKVHYRPSLYDRLLEAVALLLLCGQWGCAIYINKVYGAEVQPSPWACAVTGTLVWGLMVGASYASSRYYNFPVKVTEQNIAVQYVLAVRLIRLLNVVLGILFTGVALMYHLHGAVWLFMGGLFGMAVTTMGYFVVAHRKSKIKN